MDLSIKSRPKSWFRRKLRQPHPHEVLVIGFALMILIGTILLMSPVAARGPRLSLLDAVFTACASVCVTGLSPFDPATRLTLHGQIILISLAECGALGFMTITAGVARMTRHKSSFQSRIVLRESINAPGMHDLTRTAMQILIITFICECIGACLFAIRFIPEFGVGRGIYLSIFHSVSSFCNAGYTVFGIGDSMILFQKDMLVNVVTMILVIIGGLGFFVLLELFDYLSPALHKRERWDALLQDMSDDMRLTEKYTKRNLSLNTRVVLRMTVVLVLGGAIVFLAVEWSNPRTLGAPDMSVGDRIMGAFFQSVSTRTAGFMSVSQVAMRPVSKIATFILMFIGASPAGTAGGLKTTTTAVLVAFVWTVTRGRKDVILMKRRLPQDLVYRSVALFALAIFWIILMSSILLLLEPHIPMSSILFETVAAFGTTGMATGVTEQLSAPSLVVLMITMFSGRVGLFTLTMALASRFADHESYVRYPEARLLIG